MALVAKEIMSGVRAILDYPSPDRLKEPTVLLKLRDKTEHYFNRLNLTDRNWFLGQTTLTVNPNVNEFQINVADWGRPITCEELDPFSSEPQRAREIPIIDLQDRDRVDELGVRSIYQDHLSSIAFYRKTDGQLYALTTPTLTSKVDLVIWYEPSRALPPEFNDNLRFLDNFKNLLVAEVSLSCLPYCRYEEPFHSNLREAIGTDLVAYRDTFEEYISNDRQQQVCEKNVWGGLYANDDWWF